MLDVTRRGAALATLVIALAGCGSGSSGSPTASTAPSTAASTEPSASSAASESAAPSASVGEDLVLCAHEFTSCEIAAGTYSSAPFVHGFIFTIADSWQNNRAWPHGGEIAQPTGGFDWMAGITGGQSPNGTLAADPDPAALIAFLEGIEGFTVSPATDVEIGGVPAQQVDFVTAVEVPGIIQFPEDAWNVSVGEKIRFLIFDIDSDTTVFIVDAYHEADFDSFVELTQPILDSINWNGP
jgi:hypothetical protein